MNGKHKRSVLSKSHFIPNFEKLEYRRLLTCAVQSGFYDWGDLPDSGIGNGTNDYSTLGIDHGASHSASGPRLGSLRDPEQNGAPTIGADGDDDCHASTPIDDEDGIIFPASMIRNATSDTTGGFYLDLQLPDATSNRLDAWIDFNKDGDFDDTDEQIFDTYDLGTTAAKLLLNFTIPSGTNPTTASLYYGRFRLSTDGGLQPKYFFYNGEVEDYAIPIDHSGADVTVDLALLDSDEVTLSTDTGDLVIESDGETLMQAPLADAASLTVTGANGVENTVVVDVTGDAPIPSPDGLLIDLTDNGIQSSLRDDEVHIIGTLDSDLDPTYGFTSNEDGTIKYYDGATLEHTITLEEVEILADVSSGTGVTATYDQGVGGQNLALIPGSQFDGKDTVKLKDIYDNIPELFLAEKSLTITTGDNIDYVSVQDTTGLDTLTVNTNGQNDVISILEVDIDTDLIVNAGDRNDLVYVGVKYGAGNVNSGGDLDDIAGSVTVNLGDQLSGYADVVNVRDMDSTTDRAFDISGTGVSGDIDLTLSGVERLDFRLGDQIDTIAIDDTDDMTELYLATEGANDILSVLEVDAGTEAEIVMGARNDLVYLGVEYGGSVNSSGNLTPIAGDVSIDFGSQLSGYSDVINIRDMNATADHDYDLTSTGFTRDSDVTVDLSNVEWVDLRVGSGDDTIDNAVAYAAGFYASGENGNDTITGSSGVDTLVGGAGNDILDGGADDDALYLGTGADTAYGGTGDDWFSVGAYDAAVDSIFGDANTDEITGSIDGLDSLTSIETDSRT